MVVGCNCNPIAETFHPKKPHTRQDTNFADLGELALVDIMECLWSRGPV